LFGELYEENPRYLLDESYWDMINIWRLFKGGTAGGHLPEAGGVMDQAAIMMDSFIIMDNAEAEFKKERDT
jgi:hypothetical protein